MDSIQPATYNTSSRYNPPSTPQNIPDRTHPGSIVSKVAKNSFLTLDKCLDTNREYNRKCYQKAKEKVESLSPEERKKHIKLYGRGRRNYRKELEDQGVNIKALTSNQIYYLANIEKEKKRRHDYNKEPCVRKKRRSNYVADIDNNKKKSKVRMRYSRKINTLKKELTKIQKDSPYIRKLLTEVDDDSTELPFDSEMDICLEVPLNLMKISEDMDINKEQSNHLYKILPNDSIGVCISVIGDIQEIYINRDEFFDYIEFK